MRYDVTDPMDKTLYSFDDYDLMWQCVAEMKQKLGNIDGYIVYDNKMKSYDYAWRVALNMQKLWIGD